MTKNYQVTVDRALDAKAAEVLLIPGHKTEPVRLQAQPGAVYTLSDKASDKGPQQIYSRRQGKNLLLQLDVQRPGEAPDLILENFFEVTPGTIVGVAEDASTYRFIPNTAQELDQLGLLPEGASASQVLGGPVFVVSSGSAMAVAAAPLVGVAGFALGPVGMAAAGLAGLAALGGGGGGGSGAASGSGNEGVPASGFSAALLPDEDTGDNKTDNVTRKTQPKIGGFAPANSDVFVTIDNGSPQKVTANASGRWEWAPPPTALMDKDYQIKVTGTNAQGLPDSKEFKITVDATPITAAFSSNLSTLETGVGGKADKILNISENQAGFKYKITLSEKPARALLAADFNLNGSNLPASSVLTKVSDTEYSLTAPPAAGTTGTQTLTWSTQGKTLQDIAGNDLTQPSQAATVVTPFDLRQPSLAVTNPAGPNKPLVNESGPLQVPFTFSGGELDSEFSRLSLMGKDLGTLSDVTSVTVASEILAKLAPGFYSLILTLQDTLENESIEYQVLEIDRENVIQDPWLPEQNTQPGLDSNEPDDFLDRAGSQELIARGTPAADVFYWIRANAGTSGASNTDVVRNFYLGQDTGSKGVIDIKDLLGRGPTKDGTNLANYLKVMRVSTDNEPEIEETRLYINAQGLLNASSTASPNDLASSATQIIILDGINKTLAELVNNGNLIWQAPVL